MADSFPDGHFESLYPESFECFPYRGDALVHNPDHTPTLYSKQNTPGTICVQDPYTQDAWILEQHSPNIPGATTQYPKDLSTCLVRHSTALGKVQTMSSSSSMVPDGLDVQDAQHDNMLLQLGEHSTNTANRCGRAEQPVPRRQRATRNSK